MVKYDLFNVEAMHFIYHINSITTTAVVTTYLGRLNNRVMSYGGYGIPSGAKV